MWRQIVQAQILNKALALGSQIIFEEVQEGASFKSVKDVLAFHVMLFDAHDDLGDVDEGTF